MVLPTMNPQNIQHVVLQELCQEVKNLVGDAAEIGVYRGETAEIICEALTNSTVFLFDTFSGMPAMCVAGLDEHVQGDFKDTSVKKVQQRLARFDNTSFVAGIVPDSFVGFDHLELKLVHIDVDLYRSTKDAVSWAWNHLVRGGVILDDDYACISCRGAKKAIDEFIESHPEASFLVRNRLAIIRRK